MEPASGPQGSVATVDAATRAHFAARAATYTGGGEASLQAMLDLAAPQPGERVVDVATGTGLVLFALAEVVGRHGLAVGVDFTPAMLAQAARRRGAAAAPAISTTTTATPATPLPPRSRPPTTSPALMAAHASALPFRTGSFDVVTCRFSVHHFADPERSIAAMAAALRPGGRLVIADFVRPTDPVAARQHDELERLRGHHHVRIYEQARLEAMLAAAGCPVVAARTAEREMNPRDWLNNPNVTPEARRPLTRLIEELERRGGAGLAVRRANGEARFVRTDVVLLGVKRG